MGISGEISSSSSREVSGKHNATMIEEQKPKAARIALDVKWLPTAKKTYLSTSIDNAAAMVPTYMGPMGLADISAIKERKTCTYGLKPPHGSRSVRGWETLPKVRTINNA